VQEEVLELGEDRKNFSCERAQVMLWSWSCKLCC